MLKHLPLIKPKPDGQGFIATLMGRARDGRVPLVEYLVDDVLMRPILTKMLGRPWLTEASGERAAQRVFLDNFIEFWYHMGYDFVRFERNMGFATAHVEAPDPAPGSTKQRSWSDQHHGLIRSWDDFERYPWPKLEEVDFFPYEYLNDHLPEGMGLIASHAAGIFEHLSQIMSYEGLCLALYDDRDLVKAVADRVGSLMEGFYRHLLDLDRLIAIFPGDDMGFRTGTLIAPADLREFCLPWHKRFAAMAHARGLPYFLHSCGNLAEIMPDLIDDVGIDGKHSFEDAIMPVQEFQALYGDRIAVLGGMDLNVLTMAPPDEVRRHTRVLIETCGARGRYAIGSGNSSPSYIPLENYLAMVDEALDLASQA